MKKFVAISLAGLLAFLVVALWETSVVARSEYKKRFDAKYQGSKIEAAAAEAKCTVCHFGTSRKNRNDYGKALHTAGLTPEFFKATKSDKEKLSAAVDKALDEAQKAKSQSGKTFGELIEAGQLPGTNP